MNKVTLSIAIAAASVTASMVSLSATADAAKVKGTTSIPERNEAGCLGNIKRCPRNLFGASKVNVKPPQAPLSSGKGSNAPTLSSGKGSNAPTLSSGKGSNAPTLSSGKGSNAPTLSSGKGSDAPPKGYQVGTPAPKPVQGYATAQPQGYAAGKPQGAAMDKPKGYATTPAQNQPHSMNTAAAPSMPDKQKGNGIVVEQQKGSEKQPPQQQQHDKGHGMAGGGQSANAGKENPLEKAKLELEQVKEKL